MTDLSKHLREQAAIFRQEDSLGRGAKELDAAAALIEQQADRIAELEAQIATVAPAVDAQPVACARIYADNTCGLSWIAPAYSMLPVGEHNLYASAQSEGLPMKLSTPPCPNTRERRMSECATCNNGELLPQYGVAPHDCFYKLGKSMGQSVVQARDSWPSNFELDAESNGQCGTFHCPDCGPRFKAGLPIELQPERDTKTIDMFEASQ